MGQLPAMPTLMDTISDTLMNAFVSPKVVDPKFVDMKEDLKRIEDNLHAAERLHLRAARIELELAQDMKEFGDLVKECDGLTQATLEAQTSPTHSRSTPSNTVMSEMPETEALTASLVWIHANNGPPSAWSIVGNACAIQSALEKVRVHVEEQQVLTIFHEYIQYIQSMKQILVLRDQKQVDYEQLQGHLVRVEADLVRLMDRRRRAEQSTIYNTNPVTYVRHRVQDVRGVDREQQRTERILATQAQMRELEEAVHEAQQVVRALNKRVIMEERAWHQGRVGEFVETALQGLIDSHTEYHTKGVQTWEQGIESLQRLDAMHH